jgi:hypothetical protein
MNKKAIKRVVKRINPDISVKFHAGDNESDVMTKEVFINLESGWLDEDMQEVQREVYRLHPISTTVSPEAYVILHEVGHIESVKHYTKASTRFALKRYSYAMCKLVANDDIPYYLRARRYNNLQLERKANSWACGFIKNNPDIVQELEKALV